MRFKTYNLKLDYVTKISKNVRNRHFLFLDLLFFSITPFLVILLRYQWKYQFMDYIKELILIVSLFVLFKILVFLILGIYRRYWQSASIDELAYLIIAGVIITITQSLLYGLLRMFSVWNYESMPYSLAIYDSIFSMLFATITRLSIRLIDRTNQRIAFARDKGEKVIIVGAGAAGVMVASEIQKDFNKKLLPIGFVDDDKTKRNLRIRGLTILGQIEELPDLIIKNDVKKIIVAIPSAQGKVIRKINDICFDIDVEIQTLPGLNELIDGKVKINKLRPIRIEDLLRRDINSFDYDNIENKIKDKTVLISGAGGSIGSELVRQLIRANPKKILLLGHGENSIYEIEQELKDLFQRKEFLKDFSMIGESIIADIRDRQYMDIIFSKYRPNVVFHAAAHKHVPLMESNPFEAVKNNIIGTQSLIECSLKYAVDNFVLISSDKAVNPTNIMGVTKRIAEYLILNANKLNGVKYCAVRFGNVLGSRGSVIQTFNKQISNGGPVTVTHPEVLRYFMSIPEAVNLVIQSYFLCNGGEIFVLNMGVPVKIIELAKDMIRLSGLVENEDIEIKFTSLRPGEKLIEELFIKEEEYVLTHNKKIFIAKNACDFVPNDLNEKLNDLLSEVIDTQQLYKKLKILVPEFNYNGN